MRAEEVRTLAEAAPASSQERKWVADLWDRLADTADIRERKQQGKKQP
jgi:hypothetical protein